MIEAPHFLGQQLWLAPSRSALLPINAMQCRERAYAEPRQPFYFVRHKLRHIGKLEAVYKPGHEDRWGHRAPSSSVP